MSTGLGGHVVAVTLLSFERPPAETPPCAPRWTLKTANVGQFENGYHQSRAAFRVRLDHRQDSKGTRWMPWHQESKKGVDGCDKPR